MKDIREKREKAPKALYIAAGLCALSLLALILCLIFTAGQPGEFVPPAFDAAAQQGVPEVPEALGWGEIWQEGMEFRARVCGVFILEDGAADVYFTNTSETDAWIKLCITDDEGNVLGETGIIKSGEYVKSIVLDTAPKNGSEITMKIMAYEPNTYYSLGAVRLNTTATVKEGE